ncbi:MAG: C1 family peptidase [Chitinophagales bacterium]
MKKIISLLLSIAICIAAIAQPSNDHPAFGAKPSTISELKRNAFLASSSIPVEPQYTNPIDLRSELPPADNQGYQGSCVAWALAYALRSNLEWKKGNWSYYNSNAQRNDSRVFSPTYIYNNFKNGFGQYTADQCTTGMTFYNAFDIMEQTGVPLLAECGYAPYNSNGCNTNCNTTEIRNAAWSHRVVLSQTPLLTNLREIKRELYSHNPVFIIVYVDNSFIDMYRQNGGGQSYIWKPDCGSCNAKNTHAMVICGYNNITKLFTIMNSWGNDHYDKGFLYIKEDDLPTVLLESYVISEYRFQGSIGVPTAMGNIVKFPSQKEVKADIETSKYIVLENIKADVIGVDVAKSAYQILFIDTMTKKIIDSVTIEKGETKRFFYENTLVSFSYESKLLADTTAAQFLLRVEKDGKSPEIQKVIEKYNQDKLKIEKDVNELKLNMKVEPIDKNKITQEKITQKINLKNQIDQILSE